MFSSRKSSAPVSASYTLSKSLRFRSSATAYLNRTPASASNQTTWTWSGWVKRGVLGSGNVLFSAGTVSTSDTAIYFDTDNTFQYYIRGGVTLGSSQIFRDPSAWYHLIIAYDSTQTTSTNRIKMYVNGVQVTSFLYSTYPSLNQTTQINSNTAHYFGRRSDGIYFDGYLAEVNFIDGQQLTASSFGATNATTGQWSPTAYSGTYGTNGFHLPFTNTTSTTTLGYDTSGNSNNWTTNNISLTAGATYDSMNDVPVAYSATAANYCVLNPLRSYSNITLTNGNLTALFTDGSSSRTSFSSFGVTSGKFYWEATIVTAVASYYPGVGINNDLNASPSGQSGDTASGYMYLGTGQKFNNGTLTSYGSSFTNGDVIGIALDMNAGTITFYKNNTSQGQAFSGITGTAVPCFVGELNASVSVNFGQQPFTYTPPSGYNALDTYNLPTPAIAQGNKYMDATLYTGTLTTQSVTNAGSFKPDLVWIKSRSASTSNKLTDSVRGATKALVSDTTAAETTDTLGLTSFNSNGFTVSTDTNYNNSGATYVAWQWQAGAGSSSSNTNGSITSTVSVSTTAGFSIVTYTGTGSNATVGHGLGVVPSMIIGKARNNVLDWRVYFISIGAGNFLALNTTAASASGATWNSTTPTSSVFSVGGGSNMNVDSSTTYVAYCFAPVAGFSAFGSYTGNGSATGPFVYLGFEPKYVMVKRTDSTGDWVICDATRSPYNTAQYALYADSNLSESGITITNFVNFLSNGFQVANTFSNWNASSGTYIYMAFASNPFAYSNAF